MKTNLKTNWKLAISALCFAGAVLALPDCSSDAKLSDSDTLTLSDASSGNPNENTAPSDGETPPKPPEGGSRLKGDSRLEDDFRPDKPGEGGDPGGFGGSGTVEQGTSANILDLDAAITDTSYSSTGDDENALRIDKATVSLDYVTVNKFGGKSSNTEDGDFYGMNAAVLTTNEANVTIKNSEIKFSAQNGNGTTVNVSNTKIVTTANNSGGIQSTGGGTTIAENLDIEMSSNSSAAIRSDRSGRSVSVTGGSIKSQNGDVFYITNTHCVINLSKVNIINNGTNIGESYLMRVVGNSASHGWGSSGSNGGQTELIAEEQTLDGDIIVDDISKLNFKLTKNSTFTGTLNIVKNEQNGTAVSDNITVTIAEGSVWTLTGDCTVTSLENSGKINFNGYTIALADGTVLK